MLETNAEREILIDQITTALQQRIPVDDSMFDRIYPDHVQRLSRLHFTPVSVALRALAWRAFDSLYFYNPFEAALFAGGRSDREHPFRGGADFAAQVAAVRERL